MEFPFKVRRDAKFDAVGFGTNAVDHIVTVQEYPAFNSKVELTSYITSPGGEAASTMAALQRLGFSTAYIGRFGDDDAGTLGIRSLEAEGVDAARCEFVAGARTQVAFIIVDEQSGERTIIWKRDAKLAYAEDEAPIDAAASCKLLHLTPHDTLACIALAKAARESKAVTSIDIDNVFNGIEQLLPYVDICICSAEFPEKLIGIADLRGAMLEMRSRFGCPILGVTLGLAGSLILCGETFVETPAFAVPGGCVDTTGAGDAFRAGFLYGVLSGNSVEDAAVKANAVAALKCRALGARMALPDAIELEMLIKNS